MVFTKVTPAHILHFQSVLDEQGVATDPSVLQQYGKDETEDLLFHPEVVLKPADVPALQAVVKYCNEQGIPVTPRGAGTGLSGGALPVYGGVLLSMERFNKILNLDERNLQVTVEPGVITQELQEAVKAKGLHYPPDPASRGSCFIGGNIAENSGGPRAVKYGVVKDYVLNLEVVLPDGNVIWTGANTLKNATGYNLTQLVVGSEGTLGIVTKIVLRLVAYPQHDVLMLVPFKKAEEACEAVSAIFRAGIVPSAMEFMERDAIVWTMAHVPDAVVPLTEETQAHLLIELDGQYEDVLFREAEQLAALVQQYDIEEVLFADSAAQKEALWKLRRRVGEAVKSHSIYKEEDTVVPRAELPVLLKKVKDLGQQYGFTSVCYGHAGDGNLHVNIIKGNMDDAAWNDRLPLAIAELFEAVVKLGGTISGEHGIGWVQKRYMPIAFNEVQMNLMKQIKQVFDPKGIMNPGKIFP